MIIVEGPDGAGKTTLINHLVENTGLSVAPRVVSKDAEAMVDLKQWTEMNLAGGFQMKIFDRHRLISEPIYGPVLRSQPEPGFSEVLWFYEMIGQLYGEVRPMVIYCLPPWSVVWENIIKTEDNKRFHGNPQGSHQIYQAYFNKAITDHVLYPNAWMYDYSDDAAPEVLDIITAAVLKEKLRDV